MPGIHRSPGLSALVQELDLKKPESILDLGPPTNENVKFFSRYTENLSIQDLFRSTLGDSDDKTDFSSRDVDELALPKGEHFDVLLIWDLFHYLPRASLGRFMERLGGLCQEGALAMVTVSATASIPPAPIAFKVETRESLDYGIGSDVRRSAPQFTPREVENLMTGFSPLGVFRLRNGLQEFIFRYDQGKGS